MTAAQWDVPFRKDVESWTKVARAANISVKWPLPQGGSGRIAASALGDVPGQQHALGIVDEEEQ